MVKTQKQYYLHNMSSAYFPMNRILHRERERVRDRDTYREKDRERDRETGRET